MAFYVIAMRSRRYNGMWNMRKCSRNGEWINARDLRWCCFGTIIPHTHTHTHTNTMGKSYQTIFGVYKSFWIACSPLNGVRKEIPNASLSSVFDGVITLHWRILSYLRAFCSHPVRSSSPFAHILQRLEFSWTDIIIFDAIRYFPGVMFVCVCVYASECI